MILEQILHWVGLGVTSIRWVFSPIPCSWRRRALPGQRPGSFCRERRDWSRARFSCEKLCDVNVPSYPSSKLSQFGSVWYFYTGHSQDMASCNIESVLEVCWNVMPPRPVQHLCSTVFLWRRVQGRYQHAHCWRSADLHAAWQHSGLPLSTGRAEASHKSFVLRVAVTTQMYASNVSMGNGHGQRAPKKICDNHVELCVFPHVSGI